MPTEWDITIDASVAAKLAFEEADTEATRAWFYGLLDHGVRFTAPTLIHYELGNVLVKKPSIAAGDRSEILTDLLFGILLRETTAGAPFADAPPLSYYDASYIADARAGPQGLATFDPKMAKRAALALPVWDGPRIRGATDPTFGEWIADRAGRPVVVALRLRGFEVARGTFLEAAFGAGAGAAPGWAAVRDELERQFAEFCRLRHAHPGS